MAEIPEDLKRELVAAKNMDWMQTRLNGMYGPPCFHLEPDGRLCGRAQGWHDKAAEKMFHKFTPLHSFVERIATLTAEKAQAEGKLTHYAECVCINARQTSEIIALKAKNTRLAERLARPEKPVSDEEWSVMLAKVYARNDGGIHRSDIDALIARRKEAK